jgi:hypothetical protein
MEQTDAQTCGQNLRLDYSLDRVKPVIGVYAKLFKYELHTDWRWRNNKLRDAGIDLAVFGAGNPPAPNPSSQSEYIIRLLIVLMLLSKLGWAARQARRKYGVQKS